MTSGLLSAPGHDSPEPGYGQDQEVLPVRPAVSPRQAHPARLAATCAALACAIAAASHDRAPARPASSTGAPPWIRTPASFPARALPHTNRGAHPIAPLTAQPR